MKWIIIASFLPFIFLVNPAGADLFSDMKQEVPIYNQNVDKVPGSLKSLLGNEEIHSVIELNDNTQLEIKMVTRQSKVVEFSKLGTDIATGKGDCNEDGSLSALDALCALKMAVGNVAEDQKMDVDGNGKVTSLDARIILQSAVGLSSEVNPTIIIRTDEDNVRSIMDSQNPLNTFINAYNRGDIVIEGVGIINSIKVTMGYLVIKVTKMFGIL